MRRFLDRLLVAAFVIVISVPLAANLSGRDGGDAEAENRTLAPFPVLDRSLASIRALGPGLDAWFSDHFGFRSDLIRWYGESRYFGFGVSPSPMVIRGENGWLYYEEDGGIEDYANEPLLDAEALHAWHETVVRARDWCKARGIAYVFVIAPDKHKIYPEHYNPDIHPVTAVSRTDQVLEALADTGVAVDVRPAMMAAKDDDRLFHLTDTHWNDRGAFVAYQQIIEAVRKQRPAVPPAHDRSMFNATSRIVEGRDLAATIGLKRVLHEEDLRLLPKAGRGYKVLVPAGGYATGGDPMVVTEIPGSTLPKAVVFRDSFTSALAPFLSEHFSRAVYLWQNDFDASDVEKEHPDIVIQEIVGRHLYVFYPTPWLVPDP